MMANQNEEKQDVVWRSGELKVVWPSKVGQRLYVRSSDNLQGWESPDM